MSSHGYSVRLVRANQEASTESPGVMLGRMCISKEYPVRDVAEHCGVSRMTIYKWFVGEWIPRKAHAAKIEEVLSKVGFAL